MGAHVILKAPCLATQAVPLLSLLLLPPLPGHWLFSQGDTSKHQRRRGRPGCQHGANPTLLHPLPQTGACYPRWARSTPRIHTACHLGTLVKICFVSLINNTPFLLQTRGGRECPSGVHWHCSLLESQFRQRVMLEMKAVIICYTNICWNLGNALLQIVAL